jgi:flagellar motor switch protein FliN/FliY
MLGDVNVQVRVELGRSRLAVQEVLRLSPGAVVPLESLTRDPLDVYVNDQLVARGEAVVAGEGFAVRITEVLAPPVRPPAP